MKSLRPLICGLGLMALNACSESERDVRGQIDQWLTLGETRYFSADLGCAAGVFALRNERIRGDLPVARSVEEAVGLARFEHPFVLRIPSLSVTALSQVLQEVNFTFGARVLNAGLGARSCLPESYREDYVAALSRPGSTAIFDPSSNSLTVVDAALGRAWYARGAAR